MNNMKFPTTLEDIQTEIKTVISQLNEIHSDTNRISAETSKFKREQESPSFLGTDEITATKAKVTNNIKTEFDEAMSIIEIEEFNQLCLRIKKLRESTDCLIDMISSSGEKISALESILQEVSAIEVI
jgi:aspartokinase